MNYLDRMVVDGRDPELWRRARVGKLGGSDAAKFSKLTSAPLYVAQKRDESFRGNSYTEHGKAREAQILAQFGLGQNLALFHSEANPRFVATPDSIVVSPQTGELVVVQVKTSSKPITKIPLGYMRQMWWEQFVLGATKSLFVWEVHNQFAPQEMEAQSIIVERDDNKIEDLIEIGEAVLAGLDAVDDFTREMENS